MILYRSQGSRPSPRKKKCKKAKWLSEEALQIAVKRNKSRGEKERYTLLNAEFQRLARRDKKAFRSRHEFDSWVRKIPWRRKWQATPVFSSGKSHGQRSLAGYSPWGCKSQARLSD